MADHPISSQRRLIGLEALATPGTAPADNTFRSLRSNLEIKPKISVEVQTPDGAKAAELATLTEDSGEASVSGAGDANELQLWLAGALVGDDGTNTNVALAPVVGTPATAQIWTFTPKLGSPDTRRTYALEKSSTTFGQRTLQATMSQWGFQAEKPGKVSHNGSLVTKQVRTSGDLITPAFTPIATDPASIAASVPMSTKCFNVYVSLISRADLVNAKKTRVKSVGWQVGDRATPEYFLDCAEAAWSLASEGFAGTLNFTIGADANTLALYNAMRQGQKIWVGYEWIGPVIGVGPATYKLVVETCVLISSASEIKPMGKLLGFDIQGVFARDDDFLGAGVPGFTQAVLTNTCAALLG